MAVGFVADGMMQEDTAQSRSILIAGPLLDTALLSAGLVEDPRSVVARLNKVRELALEK